MVVFAEKRQAEPIVSNNNTKNNFSVNGASRRKGGTHSERNFYCPSLFHLLTNTRKEIKFFAIRSCRVSQRRIKERKRSAVVGGSAVFRI